MSMASELADIDRAIKALLEAALDAHGDVVGACTGLIGAVRGMCESVPEDAQADIRHALSQVVAAARAAAAAAAAKPDGSTPDALARARSVGALGDVCTALVGTARMFVARIDNGEYAQAAAETHSTKETLAPTAPQPASSLPAHARDSGDFYSSEDERGETPQSSTSKAGKSDSPLAASAPLASAAVSAVPTPPSASLTPQPASPAPAPAPAPASSSATTPAPTSAPTSAPAAPRSPSKTEDPAPVGNALLSQVDVIMDATHHWNVADIVLKTTDLVREMPKLLHFADNTHSTGLADARQAVVSSCTVVTGFARTIARNPSERSVTPQLQDALDALAEATRRFLAAHRRSLLITQTVAQDRSTLAQLQRLEATIMTKRTPIPSSPGNFSEAELVQELTDRHEVLQECLQKISSVIASPDPSITELGNACEVIVASAMVLIEKCDSLFTGPTAMREPCFNFTHTLVTALIPFAEPVDKPQHADAVMSSLLSLRSNVPALSKASGDLVAACKDRAVLFQKKFQESVTRKQAYQDALSAHAKPSRGLSSLGGAIAEEDEEEEEESEVAKEAQSSRGQDSEAPADVGYVEVVHRRINLSLRVCSNSAYDVQEEKELTKGDILTFDVALNSTVRSIKAVVARRCDIPADCQVFILGREPLNDDAQLKDFHLRAADLVYLFDKRESGDVARELAEKSPSKEGAGITKQGSKKNFDMSPADLKGMDEETRISIMNLVKSGQLSVDEAVSGAKGSPSASATLVMKASEKMGTSSPDSQSPRASGDFGHYMNVNRARSVHGSIPQVMDMPDLEGGGVGGGVAEGEQDPEDEDDFARELAASLPTPSPKKNLLLSGSIMSTASTISYAPSGGGGICDEEGMSIAGYAATSVGRKWRRGDSKRASVAAKAPKALKEGFLTKEGGNIKTWKTRWFILTSEELCYFKGPNDRSPVGVVYLEDCSSCRPFTDYQNRQHCFAMHPKAASGRVYILCAASEEDMNAWVAAIDANIPGRRSRKSRLAVAQDIITHLMQKGTTKEGIFRMPGNHAQIKRLSEDFDGCGVIKFDDVMNPHTLAGFLKKIFTDKKVDPFLPGSSQTLCWQALAESKDKLAKVRALKNTWQLIEADDRVVFRLLLQLFTQIAANFGHTNMGLEDLARAFGPSVFSALDEDHGRLLLEEFMEHMPEVCV